VQFLSVGNLGANDRISLILMDYANRRRLKIWGRARIVDESEDAELIARLEVPSYRARVERGIVIRIEAFDWNCPQHITPRFSESEVEQILAPFLEENKALKLPTQAILGDTMKVLGDGPLELVISGIRQVTPRIRSFELRDPHGNDLPPSRRARTCAFPLFSAMHKPRYGTTPSVLILRAGMSTKSQFCMKRTAAEVLASCTRCFG
jgi:hypothetical protein